MAIQTIKRNVDIVVNQFNAENNVNLINGVLDLNTFEIYEHSPDYYSTTQVSVKYELEAKTPNFNKYLNEISCGDQEIQTLLQELAGYCLCNTTKAEKAFFLVGNGCNGKSVFAKIIQSLVGEDNCSTTSLSALNGSFGLASLINSNVNIAAENGEGKINSEIFKAVVSGDKIETNRKYRDSLSVYLHTKLILLFNELPQNSDVSYGFFRKIIIIPFNRTFKGKEIDVELFEKIKSELSGIFIWGLKD